MISKENNKKTGLLVLIFLTASVARAQLPELISWKTDVSKQQVRKGEEMELLFNVSIDKNWYLYSTDFDPDLGPMVTKFSFEIHPSYELLGKIEPVKPKKKYDQLWKGEYTYFTGSAQFRQKVRVLQPHLLIKGTYEYQICSDVNGRCIPFEGEFIFTNEQVKVRQKGTAGQKQE